MCDDSHASSSSSRRRSSKKRGVSINEDANTNHDIHDQYREPAPSANAPQTAATAATAGVRSADIPTQGSPQQAQDLLLQNA